MIFLEVLLPEGLLMLKRTQTIDRDGAYQHMLLGMSKMMPADYILA